MSARMAAKSEPPPHQPEGDAWAQWRKPDHLWKTPCSTGLAIPRGPQKKHIGLFSDPLFSGGEALAATMVQFLTGTDSDAPRLPVMPSSGDAPTTQTREGSVGFQPGSDLATVDRSIRVTLGNLRAIAGEMHDLHLFYALHPPRGSVRSCTRWLLVDDLAF